MDNIDKERYEVVPIYIAKDLTIYAGGMLRYIDSFKDFRLINKYATKVNIVNKKGKFILETTGLIRREYKEIPKTCGYFACLPVSSPAMAGRRWDDLMK